MECSLHGMIDSNLSESRAGEALLAAFDQPLASTLKLMQLLSIVKN
jgi:hypothetical protein